MDNRCQTKVVENLPVELLIEIFSLIVPVDYLKVWRDNFHHNYWLDDDSNFSRDLLIAAEVQKEILRLTCKKWNAILIELLCEMNLDLRKTNTQGLEDRYIRPHNLQKLSVIYSRSLYKGWQDTGIDQWLNNSDLSCLQSLTLQDCSDLTIEGLLNINEQLTELKIVKCSKIDDSFLTLTLGKFRNLSTLMIHIDQPLPSGLIEEYLPNLNTLSLLISCQNYKDTASNSSDKLESAGLTKAIRTDSFPSQIKVLILAQDLLEYHHRILSSEDYDVIGGTSLNITHQLILDEQSSFPKSLKRFDVSRCSFVDDVFALPSTLTHLTVSYPSLPINYENLKLPSTLEYLKISGFVYHLAYDCESQYTYQLYGDRWIQILPDSAASLHTLILHLYTDSPENLFSIISDRYARSLRHLDCCIFLSCFAGLEDSCTCEVETCSLGECHRRTMIRSLTNLRELKLHNEVEDQDIEQLPVSLKELWLHPGYKQRVSASSLRLTDKKGITIEELPSGLFGCAEARKTCHCIMFKPGKGSL
ncbi:12118_t:CDS:2 [Funneliformis mosseae]|uniref:12118_t:CDS:1 n=1 Tax=Funneliformis mosseae TaxID=27381 RepID=A0A9N9AFG0_FUNMO|nr:12118_t:CDS:2 [Funneliformis mosseae]